MKTKNNETESDDTEKVFEEMLERLDVLEARMMLVATLANELIANPFVPSSVKKRVTALMEDWERADAS